MCAFAVDFRIDFLQCLHCTISGLSSRGRPVAKESRALSSSCVTSGSGDVLLVVPASGVALGGLDFGLSSAHVQLKCSR